MALPISSEFEGKLFEATQLGHERFLTIDHSWSKISHVLDVQLEIFYHKLTTVNQSDDAYENSMGNLKDLQPALHRVNP